MCSGFHHFQRIISLFLLGYLLFALVHTAQAATNPENQFGMAVDYVGPVQAGILKVNLRDAIDGKPLSNIRVVVRKISSGSADYTVAQEFTDRSGAVEFKLKDLGSGGRYYLRTTVWHNLAVDTRTLTASGNIVWKLGNVRVQVQDASVQTPVPLAGYEVQLLRASGGWNRILTTDQQGYIRVDPHGINKGIRYQLRARSLLNAYWETTDVVNTVGSHVFKVGNRALTVSLITAGTSSPLAGRIVSVHELKPDETSAWVQQRKTDNTGKAVFEVPGLGSGKRYFLRTDPFGMRPLDSGVITDAGNYQFQVGNTPVTLIDEETGKPLGGQRLVATVVAADKSQDWYTAGRTNADGTVFFDFPGVATGSVFLVQTLDPFGNGDRFYSSMIRQQGPVEIRIREGASKSLDRGDPTVRIDSPSPGKVAVSGVLVRGRASDNRGIERVIVRIKSNGKQSEVEASYDSATGQWVASISPDILATGSNVVITATAIDTTNNQSVSTVDYRVVEDTHAPVLSIFSHPDNASVAVGGFTLKGNVVDDVAVSGLHIRVEDSRGKLLLAREPVQRQAGSPRWAVNLFPDRWGQWGQARIVLDAKDYSGNKRQLALTVVPAPASKDYRRLVDRITFGVTPGLVSQVETLGWSAFLDAQLSPAQIDDSRLKTLLDPVNVYDEGDISWHTMQRMLYSERQLLELMTWFWDNHFNTDLRKSKGAYEFDENNAFRAHALGRFRDLLEVSAKSPAMLKYLDSVRNNKRGPNENYARELMELHTMGSSGGYTQQDIEELARVFTGWQIKDDRFYFRSEAHVPGDKRVLGNRIPGGGVQEGERMLDILASHPSTARFVCTKLVRFFTSDEPAAGLVSACATTFSRTDGSIRAVLRRILTSESFYTAAENNTRFKSPLRFATGVIRTLDVQVNQRSMVLAMQYMHMELYRNPVPTGWPIAGDSWVSADQLLQRINFVDRLFEREQKKEEPGFALLRTALERNVATTSGVLGMLMDDFFSRRVTWPEYQEALRVLNESGGFDPDAANTEQRLHKVLRTLLALPAGHIY